MATTAKLHLPSVSSVSNGSKLPGCGPGLETDWTVGFGFLPGKHGYSAGTETGLNGTTISSYGSYNFGSHSVFELSLYCDLIYMWNVWIDALSRLPFSDLQSDQYGLSRFEIKPNITPKRSGFHRDSTTIDPIGNRRQGDERGHLTAYCTYRICHDTMRTPIVNCSKKCWLLRSGFCVETRGSSPEPNRNLDLLHTLSVSSPSGIYCLRCWWIAAPARSIMHCMTAVAGGLL